MVQTYGHEAGTGTVFCMEALGGRAWPLRLLQSINTNEVRDKREGSKVEAAGTCIHWTEMVSAIGLPSDHALETRGVT